MSWVKYDNMKQMEFFEFPFNFTSVYGMPISCDSNFMAEGEKSNNF